MTALSPHEVEVLLSLDPLLRPKVLALRAQFPGVTLLSGYRPSGYQALLYFLHQHPELGAAHPELQQSAIAAVPGQSKHERQFACDFELAALSKLDVVNFGMAAESLGLTWGGRFTDATHPVGGADNGHVEAPFPDAALDTYRSILAWSA